MSSHYPESRQPSRRACLGYFATAALLPLAAKARCLCDGEDDAGEDVAPPAKPDVVLRICADPNNLPFSNRDHAGFEDKIAELVACNLGMSLQYDWLPQRLGFYRTALKTFDSHLVMAAPAGFDKALITDPYYRSSYVFVQRQNTERVKDLNDPRLRTLKVGVQLVGGGTPPTIALARRGIIGNIHGFPVFDETTGRPAEKIIRAVADGEIDIAIAWGPQAGYFVKRQTVPLAMTTISPAQDGEGAAAMQFTFAICMAVRRSDAKLRDDINAAIINCREKIDAILDDFSVPRLPIVPAKG